MMPNKWSHLPNAKHIDRIIASLTSHTAAWAEARYATYDAARDAAWAATYDAVYDAVYGAAHYAARDAAMAAAVGTAWPPSVAYGAAYDAILALVAYDDDCDKYLNMPSTKLTVWTIISEDPAAILLLPAVIAFEKINEMELV